jgi:hypothetical protein
MPVSIHVHHALVDGRDVAQFVDKFQYCLDAPDSQCISFFEPAQSAESEVERFGAGIEKLDLKLAIGDLSRLPDELVEPLFD